MDSASAFGQNGGVNGVREFDSLAGWTASRTAVQRLVRRGSDLRLRSTSVANPRGVCQQNFRRRKTEAVDLQAISSSSLQRLASPNGYANRAARGVRK